MPSIKRRIATASQNSSTCTSCIKASLTRSAVFADISLNLVATKVFPSGLIAVQTAIFKRLSHRTNKCILFWII